MSKAVSAGRGWGVNVASFRVGWEIELEADSPREAAELALAIQRDPDSRAVSFQVREARYGRSADETIDLDEPAEIEAVRGMMETRHNLETPNAYVVKDGEAYWYVPAIPGAGWAQRHALPAMSGERYWRFGTPVSAHEAFLVAGVPEGES